MRKVLKFYKFSLHPGSAIVTRRVWCDTSPNGPVIGACAQKYVEISVTVSVLKFQLNIQVLEQIKTISFFRTLI